MPAIAGGVRDYSSHRSDQAQAQAILQTKVNLVAAATRDRRKEKENMAEFIAKKREMFLVQMSLDTKREEIRKLEEKAQMKEEALKKSEQMLEEDAIRFDTFLKENDKKAHEAIKKAAKESGTPAPASALRREPKGPRDGFTLNMDNVFENKVHLLTPIPYVFKPMERAYGDP